MAGFIVYKVGNGLLTLWLVISLTFFLVRILPGGPFDTEKQLPPQIKANINARYHLNDPLWQQYTAYLFSVTRGDLGPSYKYVTRSVNDIVLSAAWVSFRLGMLALILGVGLGVLLGTFAGMTQRRWLDGLLSLLGMTGISTPSFIFGALLVLIFSYTLNLLPAARLETPRYWIMPVVALSLTPFAYSFLLVRSTVQNIRQAQFVRIKTAFGLPDCKIMFAHVLRNALVPLISILGPLGAAVVTGSFAVELIFAVPGMGRYFVSAVTNRDYTLVMGITIVYSVVLIVFNMLTDILYGFADPRLKEARTE